MLQTLLLSLGFGLITSSVLAIAAVGITLQFGVTNYLNLAYGDLLTFGVYIAFVANQRFGLSIWIGLLAAILLTGLLAWLINLLVLRPFTDRGTSRVMMLVVTVGVSLILQNVLLALFGEQFQKYAVDTGTPLHLGPFLFTPLQLGILGLAVGTMLAIHFLLRSTRLGKAMRAVSDSPDLARISGISTRQIVNVVWLIAGGLAGLSGVVLALNVVTFTPTLGFGFIFVIFASMVLGGIGSPYGAMLGALVVGMGIATEVSAQLGLPPAQPAFGETYILGFNWSFFPALLGGGLAAMLLALVVGLLSLHRLRNDYFSIVTVAISLILWTIAGNATLLVNGWDGITGVAQPLADVLNLDPNGYGLFYLGLCSVILVLVYLFAERLYRSPFGRALRCVREDEIVAQGLGKNVFTLRLRAFVIGAFIAGIGGGLLVTYVDAFNPSAWTSPETFFLWAALLLGGSANNRGAMLGAFLVPVLFAEATRFLPNFYSPEFVNASRYIVVGILLILTVRFRPQGLLAERRLRISKHQLLAFATSTASPNSTAHLAQPDAVPFLPSEHNSSESEEAHNGR